MARGRAQTSGSQEEKDERGGRDREEAQCLVSLNLSKELLETVEGCSPGSGWIGF